MNQIMRGFILIVFLSVISTTVQSAVLSGRVFDYSLEEVSEVKISINTIPRQQIILKDNKYSLNIGIGSYELVAYQIKGGEIVGYAKENIFIKDEGNYTFDMILYPYLGNEEDIIYNDPLIDSDKTPIKQKERDTTLPALSIIFGVCLIFAGVMVFMLGKKTIKCKPTREPPAELKEEKSSQELPEDLIKIVQFIKQEGGRSTQKEIRSLLPLSEAKVSLMITDLESRGIIKKIKRGRGNIIILVEQDHSLTGSSLA